METRPDARVGVRRRPRRCGAGRAQGRGASPGDAGIRGWRRRRRGRRERRRFPGPTVAGPAARGLRDRGGWAAARRGLGGVPGPRHRASACGGAEAGALQQQRRCGARAAGAAARRPRQHPARQRAPGDCGRRPLPGHARALRSRGPGGRARARADAGVHARAHAGAPGAQARRRARPSARASRSRCPRRWRWSCPTIACAGGSSSTWSAVASRLAPSSSSASNRWRARRSRST